MPHICLVSAAEVWANPRAVREADALAEAGCQVTLITRSRDIESEVRDGQLMNGRRWKSIRISTARRGQTAPAWFTTAMRARLALTGAKVLPGISRLGEESVCRGYPHLLKAVTDCHADLYIAHTQQALPIAAHAAAHNHVPYAFDCEDLCAEEVSDKLASPIERRILKEIEQRFLPGCAYVSATCNAMADYLVDRYHIARPITLYNAGPISQISGQPIPQERSSSSERRIVWVTATIGRDRGLEDVIHALSNLPGCFRLQAFGRVDAEYRQQLERLATQLHVANRVKIGPWLDSGEVISATCKHDIGLTLQRDSDLYWTLTTPNKLFLYLQCGLAIAATETPGQGEILDRVPGCGFTYRPGDINTLTEGLLRFQDEQTLKSAQSAAWVAGQTLFCWERQQHLFLEAVRKAVGGRL